jgi:hypothetical protein
MARLKATGHSWRYISDTLGIQTGLCKAWADDKEWQKKVAAVAEDIVRSGIDLLNLATVDLVEGLLELARNETEGSVRLRAIVEALDRMAWRR